MVSPIETKNKEAESIKYIAKTSNYIIFLAKKNILFSFEISLMVLYSYGER